MAKKKDKRLGDDPFERFLPQIKDTRKKSKSDTIASENESTSDDESVDTIESENTIVNNDVYTNVDTNNDVYNDKNTNVNNNNVVDTNNYTSTSDDESVDEDAAVSTIENNDVGTKSDDYERNGTGAFTITKKTKNENYVRMTYYFRRDQLKAIDQLHKQSGRDKSELVRMAVDALIETARVE